MYTPIDKFTPPEKPDFIRDFPPPRVFSKKGSFVWWWWMFLFEENGVKKQIVGFWTTKTYKNVLANGVNWGPAANLKGNKNKFTFNGMSTFWYWDGKEFFEKKPKNEVFTTVADDAQAEITSDDIKLKANRENTRLKFKRDDFELDITSMSPSPPRVGYKRTMVTKRMGFDGLKIYHAGWAGTLTTKGNKRELNGSLYMQHITLNTPAMPWLWGVFHKKDGSYLTYFSTFLGPLMFRRSKECKPRADNKFKFLNKNLNYTPKGQETKRFKHIKYNVFRQDNGLPGFEVWGELDNEKLRIKVITKAKCTYAFERKKIWRNKFFYNEFPSGVVEIEYTDKDGKAHIQTGEDWNGNCEYSWGILLS